MAGTSSSLRQAAAIPIRSGQVCLVMSRSGKRWIVPKGGIELGHTAGETALREAWEEAGLVGFLQDEPVGSYRYQKCDIVCHVTVFVMHVTEVADAWPECVFRPRLWLPSGEALARIEEPSLRNLMERALKREVGNGGLILDFDDPSGEREDQPGGDAVLR